MKRFFSTTDLVRSFIGKKPIYVPMQTTIDIVTLPLDQRRKVIKGRHSLMFDRIVHIKGPLGNMNLEIPEFLSLEHLNKDKIKDNNSNTHIDNFVKNNENLPIISKDNAKVDNVIAINVVDPKNKYQKTMWGTIRSILNNNVVGVNDGHLAILKLVGTGYKATMEEIKTDPEERKLLHVKVGTSVPRTMEIPENVKITLPLPTTIVVEGLNKQQVMLFASKIRNLHPPEPYKGKGIYLNDEKIKLKNKKIK